MTKTNATRTKNSKSCSGVCNCRCAVADTMYMFDPDLRGDLEFHKPYIASCDMLLVALFEASACSRQDGML